MVSGSSVGNTVTTGSVTIPMMKKTGYKARVCRRRGGGRLHRRPDHAPHHGRRRLPDGGVHRRALRHDRHAGHPAGGAVLHRHLHRRPSGGQEAGPEGHSQGAAAPAGPAAAQQIYLLAPLVLLVVMVSTNTYTMAFSAAIAIVAAMVVGLLDNRGGRSPAKSQRPAATSSAFGKIVDALEGGAKGSITVAVACGVAGIISGCITVTGLASKLLSAIVSLSGGHMMIALVLTMLCCIVLGMGVPTTANYCIMAATCAPILMDPSIGVDQDGGPLLRVLLRHCGGHHAAGGPGGLCRQRHCQGGPHEDRVSTPQSWPLRPSSCPTSSPSVPRCCLSM